jgi:flagellar biosynthetic protein FliR
VNELLRQLSEQQVAGFMLVIARIAPLFLVAPMFSSKMIPRRVKGIAAVGLAVGIAPMATADERLPIDVMSLAEIAAKELLVGLAFAFAISVLFAAVNAAGGLLDTLIGFSFGALVDPITGNNSSIIGQLYALTGVAIFIAVNGDAWVIQGLFRTYELVPLVGQPSVESMVGGVQEAFSGIFIAALELSAPVVLAVLLTDAAFGVVSRVVPQLNVFAVGFSAKVMIGLLVLGVSLPFAAGWLSDEMQRSVAAALDSLKVA